MTSDFLFIVQKCNDSRNTPYYSPYLSNLSQDLLPNSLFFCTLFFSHNSSLLGCFLSLSRKCSCGVAGATLQGPVWARAPQTVSLQAASLPGDLLSSPGPAGPGLRGLSIGANAVAGRQFCTAAVSHQKRLRSKSAGQRCLWSGPRRCSDQDGGCAAKEIAPFTFHFQTLLTWLQSQEKTVGHLILLCL